MMRTVNPLRIFSVIFFVVLATALAFPGAGWAVPSYARQMEMPCSGCHVQFPVLNSFGRAF